MHSTRILNFKCHCVLEAVTCKLKKRMHYKKYNKTHLSILPCRSKRRGLHYFVQVKTGCRGKIFLSRIFSFTFKFGLYLLTATMHIKELINRGDYQSGLSARFNQLTLETCRVTLEIAAVGEMNTIFFVAAIYTQLVFSNPICTEFPDRYSPLMTSSLIHIIYIVWFPLQHQMHF